MQGLWDSSAVPLLEVFQELNHGSFAEPNFIRAAENGVLSVAPSWPGALSRLRGLGVALLQDLPWWGPVMERRLRTGLKTHVRFLLQTGLPKCLEMDPVQQTPLTKRKKALVLHEDPTAGFKLADWFAEHGYQAILTRTVDDIKPHLGDIRPDVIVVDCPPALTISSDALPRLQAVFRPSRLSP